MNRFLLMFALLLVFSACDPMMYRGTVTYYYNEFEDNTISSVGERPDPVKTRQFSFYESSFDGKTIQIASVDNPLKYYEFSHWNTKSDGSGKSYYPGDTVTIKGVDDMSLYAQYNNSFSALLSVVFEYTEVNTDLNWFEIPASIECPQSVTAVEIAYRSDQVPLDAGHDEYVIAQFNSNSVPLLNGNHQLDGFARFMPNNLGGTYSAALVKLFEGEQLVAMYKPDPSTFPEITNLGNPATDTHLPQLHNISIEKSQINTELGLQNQRIKIQTTSYKNIERCEIKLRNSSTTTDLKDILHLNINSFSYGYNGFDNGNAMILFSSNRFHTSYDTYDEFVFELDFKAYSDSIGTWEIEEIRIVETYEINSYSSGYENFYSYNEIVALGMPVSFNNIASKVDTSAPTLSSLNVETPVIDIGGGGSALLEIDCAIIDDVSVASLILDYDVSTSSYTSSLFFSLFDYDNPVLIENIAEIVSMDMSQDRIGDYAIVSVLVTDVAGNQREYTRSDLDAMGISLDFTLIDSNL